MIRFEGEHLKKFEIRNQYKLDEWDLAQKYLKDESSSILLFLKIREKVRSHDKLKKRIV